MKRTLSQLLGLIFQSIVYWSISFCVFIFIRYFALNEEEGLTIDPKFDVPITTWLEYGVILGVIVGFFYAINEFIFDKYVTPRVYLGLSILLKTLFYLLLLIVSLSFLVSLLEYTVDRDLPNEKGWWRTNPLFWLMAAYFWLSSLIFSFIKMAIERFGRGLFFKMLIGKYRRPREEKKIFMFLDLKSSTTTAEKLGHFKYSQFIQDCFIDLNAIINKYDAEIYQYVGDEAVLTWNYKNGLEDNRCVNIYFDFRRRLLNKKEYYINKYGVLPEFKAGMHGGNLMMAEVGTIKKEMAYHGDVINTTARIQGECNKYGEQLLMSEALINDLNLDSSFVTNKMGSVILKGKNEEVMIYSLNLS